MHQKAGAGRVKVFRLDNKQPQKEPISGRRRKRLTRFSFHGPVYRSDCGANLVLGLGGRSVRNKIINDRE